MTTVSEEDSFAIEMTEARLSNHDGRRQLGLGFFFFFFFVKLGALKPYYERNLFYY